MDVNYRYFVQYAAGHNGTVLDYGCGRGQVVEALRGHGVECYGTDLYYASGEDRLDAQPLIDRGWIKPFKLGEPLPFEDDSFDLILSNMVLEHVADIRFVASELDRVLRPDGVMLHHFPTRVVLRETHIGIPLAHRLPKGRLRLAYTTALRRVGLGRLNREGAPKEWAVQALGWIDSWCHYRPEQEITDAFGGYSVCHREAAYCEFRAGRRLPFPRVQSFGFQRIAFTALELRR